MQFLQHLLTKYVHLHLGYHIPQKAVGGGGQGWGGGEGG